MEIPRSIAESEGVPEDLDSAAVGPYAVPSPRRRRLAGRVYLVGALLCGAAAIAGLPVGLWGMATALAVIGLYHVTSAWDLKVRESAALEIANRAVPFAVGHASAQVSFQGWRARPVWNVLVFSADEPPAERALVRVDALSGGVVDSYSEPIADG